MNPKHIITMALILMALSSNIHSNDVSTAKKTLEKWSETFGIQHPWDTLPHMSHDLKRHRGALAYTIQRLEHNEIPPESVENLYRDLGNLLALKTTEQVLKAKPSFTDYQTHFKIDVFQLWQQLITETKISPKWDTTFKEAYYSQADGAGILFDIRLPPASDNQKIYPLVVTLKGGLKVNPSAEFPFIQVKPSRGGIWGYRAISRYDVMQVIAFMQRHYPIASDRIHLVGFSAGASGAMHVASSYPNAFATVLPMVAVGNNYPIANFKNLPIAIHHGTVDWTSSICNARVQYQKMQALGCPAILKEYPNVGHSVPKPHEPIMNWMLEQTRDPSPTSITQECESPTLGRTYWLHIREFQDPHQRAFVNASIDPSRKSVIIHPQNIQVFTLDPERLRDNGNPIKTVEIDGKPLTIKGAAKYLNFRFQKNKWQIAPNENDTNQSKRAYHAGAAANLYEGEPLLIVYGTQSGQSARIDQLRLAAREIAGCGGPPFYAMPNRFPVLPDSALSPEQEKNCNLILIGTPADNSITQKLLSKLPITLQNNNLKAGNRPKLQLNDQVVSLLHPNPNHPKQLIYLVAPFTEANGLARFSKNARHFLIGSDGFDRISQADLSVQNLDHQIARQMQFDKNWNWISLRGSDKPIPPRFSDRTSLSQAYMNVMKQKSSADFALWWGPADKGMWGTDFNVLKPFDPAFYSQADFHTQHHRAETMTGEVSGADLVEIWNRWGQNKELISVPEMQTETLVDQKQYRIHIPMDLYIKLGQRKKNLNNPKPGATISSEDLISDIFQ